MISVIIPTHNRRKMLSEAIDSVLNQKNVEIEIIIVDDASTDDTHEFINNLSISNVKYIKNDVNLFAHESRKVGYSICEGEYVIFMDDDDFYLDDSFFSNVISIFENDNNISLVMGSTVSIFNGEYGKKIDLGGSGKINQKEYINNFGVKFFKPSSTLTAVFRKSALDMFDFGSFRMINDTCIYLNGMLGGDIYLINMPVAGYRIHNLNMSKSKFKISFIKECLAAKIDIYNLLCKMCLLNEPKIWLTKQLEQSMFYFIICSNKNIFILLYIFVWSIFKGKGTTYLIIRDALQKKGVCRN